ncbi:MAG: LuxR C-terminal-related transcriptional regulator [Nocardioides sp.]|uniref:LuxR C-terminal-related transcriptional regulator n=1 Tax=Nocardioides nematodiphilus TaxID=2849669 RepID=UPI001CDA40ED|nr:response regulator transcription factor [Nocardioides nematodiphilus]MCA1983066.1 response regulator transcription factor [Nocardioides nematodiphilus]
MTQPTSRSQIKVVIIEDHVLFAESLELALSVEGYDVKRVELPLNGTTPSSILASVIRQAPRIVLLDLDLGHFGDGLRFVGPLATAGINVVVVTANPDKVRWGEALRYGARTVRSKSNPLNEILAVVRRLGNGQPVMEVEERESLLRLWHQRNAELAELQAKIDRLTPRESQVLGRLMEGMTVHDIAAASVVSEATVRTQVKAILAKLEVTSQIAAVGLAHHVGWHPAAEPGTPRSSR